MAIFAASSSRSVRSVILELDWAPAFTAYSNANLTSEDSDWCTRVTLSILQQLGQEAAARVPGVVPLLLCLLKLADRTAQRRLLLESLIRFTNHPDVHSQTMELLR